jgi:hypothetical protein
MFEHLLNHTKKLVLNLTLFLVLSNVCICQSGSNNNICIDEAIDSFEKKYNLEIKTIFISDTIKHESTPPNNFFSARYNLVHSKVPHTDICIYIVDCFHLDPKKKKYLIYANFYIWDNLKTEWEFSIQYQIEYKVLKNKIKIKSYVGAIANENSN